MIIVSNLSDSHKSGVKLFLIRTKKYETTRQVKNNCNIYHRMMKKV